MKSEKTIQEAQSLLTQTTGDREDFNCEWLPADASNRFYGRLTYLSGKTLILMVMNAPEAFKSEEAGHETESDKKGELPFVTVARAFEAQGVRVPKILAVSHDSSFLILEDLGDELLYKKRAQAPALIWYEKAIDELIPCNFF